MEARFCQFKKKKKKKSVGHIAWIVAKQQFQCMLSLAAIVFLIISISEIILYYCKIIIYNDYI